jgi:hypothetical protein
LGAIEVKVTSYSASSRGIALFSLRNLCVLGVSAVDFRPKMLHRRDAEYAKEAQSLFATDSHGQHAIIDKGSHRNLRGNEY